MPGLILEAKTRDRIFHFKAIGNQQINDKPFDVTYSRNTEICNELNKYHKFVRAKRNIYLFEDKGDVIIYERPLAKEVIFMEVEN